MDRRRMITFAAFEFLLNFAVLSQQNNLTFLISKSLVQHKLLDVEDEDFA